MGGQGSGRRAPADVPVDEDVLKQLWKGRLRKRLLDGLEDAQTEYLLRLDELRLQARISSKQHQDLINSAAVRRSIALHVNAEKRTRRAEQAVKRLEEARRPASTLRDVGPPPDSLAPDETGGSDGGAADPE